MDQERGSAPGSSRGSSAAHHRADLPETGLRSSQPVPAPTMDGAAFKAPEAGQGRTQASLQSTLPASTIFESWLPMDSEIFGKGNCNARVIHVGAATTNSGVRVILALMEFAMKQWASTLSMLLRASSSSASLFKVTRGRIVTSVKWYLPSTLSSRPSASLSYPTGVRTWR